MVTGTNGESVGAQETAVVRVSNQSEHHRGRFDKEYQSAESENMLGRETVSQDGAGACHASSRGAVGEI